MHAGAGMDPQAAAGFPASEEGRPFIELSSRGWCEADIAAGADPARSAAAAEHTFAFYAGAES